MLGVFLSSLSAMNHMGFYCCSSCDVCRTGELVTSSLLLPPPIYGVSEVFQYKLNYVMGDIGKIIR